MEKVWKVKLKMENLEQIVRIDQALQKCARLIIQSFAEKCDQPNPFIDAFELDESCLDVLEKQFHHSAFYSGKGFDVAEAFDETLFPLTECNDQTIMRILYPVLFYTLVLKNFNNPNTVNRRAKRGSKSWGIKEHILEVPAAEKKVAKDIPGICELSQLMNRAKQKEMELQEQLKTEFQEHLNFSLHEIQDLLIHAEAAMYLSDGRIVAAVKTMAERALFAKSILESQKENSKPIDTLLRLYVMDAVDGVVSVSAELCNGFRHPELPGRYLLATFHENDGGQLEDILDATGQRTAAHEVVLDAEEISDDFPWLYAQLSRLTFTLSDVQDMLDYYFADGVLKWYQSWESEVRKYVDAVNGGLQTYHNIDERYLNLERLHVPWQLRLFEQSDLHDE